MFLKKIKIKKYKRIGRGESSGKGKTSGRGNKGQNSRSGSSKNKVFSGTFISFFKKLPKFGFKKINKYFSLNLLNLNILPFTLFSLFILKKIFFVKKNIFFIKFFFNYFFLKKNIFYNFVFNINTYLFFNKVQYFIF